MRRSYVRYSEAFKRQVVAELEDGKYSSIGEANRIGVKSLFACRATCAA